MDLKSLKTKVTRETEEAKRELYCRLAERRKANPDVEIWSILLTGLLSIIDGIDSAHQAAKEVAKTIVSLGFQLYLERDTKVRNTIPQKECEELRENLWSKSVEYVGGENECQRLAEKHRPWEPIRNSAVCEFLGQISSVIENIGGTPKDLIESMVGAFGESSWQVISHCREMSISIGYAVFEEAQKGYLLKAGDFMSEEKVRQKVRQKIAEIVQQNRFQEFFEGLPQSLKEYIQKYL